MKTKTKIKAYSLVEILVTLAIFGVLSVALMQSLLENLMLSNRITARSQIGSELDQMVSLIQKDFRNADDIDTNNCKTVTTPVAFGGKNCNSICIMSTSNGSVAWCYVAPSATTFGTAYRFEKPVTGAYTIKFTSSSLVDIKKLNFEVNLHSGEDLTATGASPFANILVTLEAENNNLGITDQVRQFTITTRNYLIK